MSETYRALPGQPALPAFLKGAVSAASPGVAVAWPSSFVMWPSSFMMTPPPPPAPAPPPPPPLAVPVDSYLPAPAPGLLAPLPADPAAPVDPVPPLVGPPPAVQATVEALTAQVEAIQAQLDILVAGLRPVQPPPAAPVRPPAEPPRPRATEPATPRRTTPKPKPKPNPLDGRGPMMREQARGGPVRALEHRLEALGFDVGRIDTRFGKQTTAAVKRFQRKRGLEADGIVGPKTWKQLDIKVRGKVRYPGPADMVGRQGKYLSPSITGRFDRLVAAARRAGVSLQINSSFRTRAEQTELWNRYGRNPARVAPPGSSMHEKGLAIDFANTAGAWSWLKRNAARFGLYNYPAEPWHYSINGH